MTLNINQRISKLWAASLNLLSACEEACPHLPEQERKKLSHAINTFLNIINDIRK